jgi:hypothetical protein
MAKKTNNTMCDRPDVEPTILVQPTDDPIMAELGCADRRLPDPLRMPQGLRLIGVVSQRWAREFEKFTKVYYEIHSDHAKYIMTENHQKPLDAAKCLALGECGCWSVEIHVYQDKVGKSHYQITRNTGARTGSF